MQALLGASETAIIKTGFHPNGGEIAWVGTHSSYLTIITAMKLCVCFPCGFVGVILTATGALVQRTWGPGLEEKVGEARILTILAVLQF